MFYAKTKTMLLAALTALIVAAPAAAFDKADLTRAVQQDLHKLGYDPGNLEGEVTLQTAMAISKFQAENDLEVTGEVTPQLAGILSAMTSPVKQVEAVPPEPAVTEAPPAEAPPEPEVAAEAVAEPEPAEEPVIVAAAAAAAEAAQPPAEEVDPEVLEAARQECLREKIAEAEEAAKKRRGYTSLASAVGRTAAQLGNSDVSRTAGDVYLASATANDLNNAARDLGITDDELAECDNPL